MSATVNTSRLPRIGPYRVHQAKDAEAFETMLGFYRLKVLYVETARLLLRHLTGTVEAFRLISLLSVLRRWCRPAGLARQDRDTCRYGPVVAAFLMLCSFGYAAQLVSPDLYATFFLLLAALFFLEKWDVPAALALVCAFLVRPDHLAFIGVFFVFAAIYGSGTVGDVHLLRGVPGDLCLADTGCGSSRLVGAYVVHAYRIRADAERLQSALFTSAPMPRCLCGRR